MWHSWYLLQDKMSLDFVEKQCQEHETAEGVPGEVEWTRRGASPLQIRTPDCRIDIPIIRRGNSHQVLRHGGHSNYVNLCIESKTWGGLYAVVRRFASRSDTSNRHGADFFIPNVMETRQYD